MFSLRTIHFYKKLPSSIIFSLTSNFVSASTLGSRASEVTLQEEDEEDEEEMFEMPHQELLAAVERKAVIARPVIEPIDEEEDDEVSPGR